jgi:DNA modification methylase
MNLIQGDCIDILKTLEDNSIDAICTDPPYGLSFMGKKWDYDVPSIEVWQECLRVLKPGGYLLSFAGTRTQHKIASGIEDAGFEIRDMIAWVYGSGFPKSLNIGKAVDKINGETGRLIKFTGWMRTTGLKPKQIDDLLKENGMISPTSNFAIHYFNDGQPAIPTSKMWEVIRPICGEIPKWVDELVERIEKEREIIGINKNCGTDNSNGESMFGIGAVGKEVNITKGTSEWEGWGTSLKPALEPITVARKPLAEKTVAENCLKWGVGGINIDATRIPSYNDAYNNDDIFPSHKLSELRGKLYTLLFSCVADKKDFQIPSSVSEYALKWRELKDYLDGYLIYLRLYDELTPLFQEGDQVSFQQLHDAHDGIYRFQQEQTDSLLNQDTDHLSSLDDFLQLILTYIKVNDYTNNDTTPDIKSQGRFPANLILDGSDEVVGLFPESKVSGAAKNGRVNLSGIDYSKEDNIFGGGIGKQTGTLHNDSGSASRFFYCAKASKSERNMGCDGLDETYKKRIWAQSELSKTDFGEQQNKFPHTNHHPTVKPIALMEYLVKLVSREGHTILDPFLGSGSTGIACKKLNRHFIGIEKEPEYIKIAEARINSIPQTLL